MLNAGLLLVNFRPKLGDLPLQAFHLAAHFNHSLFHILQAPFAQPGLHFPAVAGTSGERGTTNTGFLIEQILHKLALDARRQLALAPQIGS